MNLNLDKKINNVNNITDLYNKYGLIKEGVVLSDDNKEILLSSELKNDGWQAKYTFHENSNLKSILDEVELYKNLYEVKIAFLKDEPFAHIRCLLLKEKNL